MLLECLSIAHKINQIFLTKSWKISGRKVMSWNVSLGKVKKFYLKSFEIDFLIATTRDRCSEPRLCLLMYLNFFCLIITQQKKKKKNEENRTVMDECKVHRQVAHYQCFLLLAATLCRFFCFLTKQFSSFWPVSWFFITC